MSGFIPIFRLTRFCSFPFSSSKLVPSFSSNRQISTSLGKRPRGAKGRGLEGIEDLIPTLWSPFTITYDKDVTLRISHSGPQCQQFYRAMINRASKHKVFLTMRILSVVSVQVEKKSGYGYLKEIIVRRAYPKLYKFKEGDFPELHLNKSKDMLLLIAQNKLFNLEGDVIVDFVTALKMFTRRIIVQNMVKDVQLGVESYQRKLNLTKSQRSYPLILAKEPYSKL
nr:hypothetical protein [Tanacetum cinerariifolium]